LQTVFTRKYFGKHFATSSMVFIAEYCFVITDLAAAEYKHILRIAGKDIEGGKKLIVAISEIKGVGYNFAQVLTQSLNINPNMRVGFLTENEIREIERAIADPRTARMPEWYLNRRKNTDTGSNSHLITSDLDFAASNDIDREKTVMSWRGYRHMFGLRVRGQCTRTTGRKGGAVGVKKVKLLPGGAPGAPGAAAPAAGAAAAPAAGAKDAGKPAAAPAAGAKPAAGAAAPAAGSKPATPAKEPAKK
jgi:small subunit ribosomal protein S13